VGLRVDWRIFRPILIYAAPLIPVGFAQFGLHQADRYLIRALDPQQAGYAATGIYGLGYKISYLVTTLMLGPFIQIWQPWIFGVREPQERARLVARVSTYTMLAIGAVTMGVILLGRQGVLVLAGDPDMRAAYEVVPLISAGYVFWALYKATEIPLFIAKRTTRLLVINVAALAFNVVANFYLIPPYGYVGAAVATCATFGLLGGLGMIASRSEAHVPFELGRIVGILGVVAGCAALTLAIDDGLASSGDWSFFAAFHWKVAIGIAGYLILWFGVLRPRERLDVRGWARARLPRSRSKDRG
jgi:O-antigen/teichoic acid export membrane protein